MSKLFEPKIAKRFKVSKSAVHIAIKKFLIHDFSRIEKGEVIQGLLTTGIIVLLERW